jgi:sarcosine oxidase subunit gamma
MADALPARGALDHLADTSIVAGPGTDALRIAPRTGRALVLVRVRPEDSATVQAIDHALGTALPTIPNTRAIIDGGQVIWLGPDEWVIDVAADGAAPRIAALQGAAAGKCAVVLDITAGRTCLAICGTAAVDLLRKGCPIDLHPQVFATGACVRTMLARAGVLLLCVEAGREYHLVVDRSYADYLWHWLADAARQFADTAPAAHAVLTGERP